MKIEYKNRRIEKVCTIFEEAQKNFNVETAQLLHQRIDQITAVDSIDMLLPNPLVPKGIGRCHPLKGDMDGMYAMDLKHPYRLVFTEKDRVLKIVKILEIIDYH